MTSLKDLAVQALRTTELKQGFGRLFDPVQNCYCAGAVVALGTGCATIIPFMAINLDAGLDIDWPKLEEVMSEIQEDFTLSHIAMMNDNGKMTFKEIADWIENQ